MSWQEDLRTLDGELAAGRISADEYRRQRDGLLSFAAGTSGPQAPSQSETTQFIPPISAAPPQQANPDRTQVVSGPGAAADRTQVVTGMDMGAERTQYVSGVAPPAPFYGTQPSSGGFPAQQPDQFGWNTPANDPRSQWGGPGLSGSPTWAQPEPEAFGKTTPGRMKPLVIALVLALVAGAGVGTYFLFFQGDGSPQQAGPGTSAPPATTPSQQPKDELEIAKLPGTSGQRPEFKTFADIENANALANREYEVYRTAKAGDCRLVTSKLPDSVDALVIAVATDSASDATTAATSLAKIQGDHFGMKPYAGAAPAGVTVTQIGKTKDHPAAIRGHYAAGKTVVRVQVSGPDVAQISKVFDEVLAAQLDALPVDG